MRQIIRIIACLWMACLLGPGSVWGQTYGAAIRHTGKNYSRSYSYHRGYRSGSGYRYNRGYRYNKGYRKTYTRPAVRNPYRRYTPKKTTYRAVSTVKRPVAKPIVTTVKKPVAAAVPVKPTMNPAQTPETTPHNPAVASTSGATAVPIQPKTTSGSSSTGIKPVSSISGTPKPSPIAPGIAPISNAVPTTNPAQKSPITTSQAPSVAKTATKPSYLPDYQEPKKTDNEMPLSRVILDLFLKLGVVLGVAYVSILGLRKFMSNQGMPIQGRKGHLRVIESMSLGPNRSLHLVKVGSKVMMLASTPEQITAMGEVDDPELLTGTVPSPTTSPAPSSAAPANFSAALNRAYGTTPATEDKPDIPEQVQGSIKHLWDRVEEIRGLRGRKGS